jgi:hypothetical protein
MVLPIGHGMPASAGEDVSTLPGAPASCESLTAHAVERIPITSQAIVLVNRTAMGCFKLS